jgi:cardiolipin synthase (CMP-forming)
MNIPNLITFLRIILVPVVVILLIQDSFVEASVVFLAASVSDAADGFLARVMRQQTIIGAYLDPIADKALLASTFVTLSILHVIPPWLSVIVISRDFIILLGVSVLFLMGFSVEIHPSIVSKITTVLQASTLFLALFSQCLPCRYHSAWLEAFYWATAIFTVISGLHYMSRGLKIINNHPASR